MIQYIGGGSTPTGKLQDIVFDAKKNGDYAKEQGDYAKAQGDEASEAINNTNTATNNANTQANYAKSQGDYAKSQGDYAKSVADQNKTNWLTAVNTFTEIETKYPNPAFGDTVQTIDDCKIYRWDGTQWVWTQQYNDTAMTDVQNKINEINQKIEYYDSNIEINHNLGDYPLAHVMTEELYGFGGYGEYGVGNKYQLLNKVEYIDTNTLRIHLFLSDAFSGSPIVNKITDLEYQITFTGQDGYLTVYLIPMTTTKI